MRYVAVLLAALAWGVAAEAQAPDLAAHDKAASDLKAALEPRGGKQPVPAADDPLFMAYARQMETVQEGLGNGQIVPSAETFASLCGPVVEIMDAYQSSGANALSAKGGAEALEALKLSNTEAHFEQIFPMLVFSGRCNVRHLAALERSVGPLPKLTKEQREGARMMRAGIAAQVSSLLGLTGVAELDGAQRRSIETLLVEDAPHFAPHLTVEQRKQVRDLIESLPTRRKAGSEGRLDQIDSALKVEGCSGFCAF